MVKILTFIDWNTYLVFVGILVAFVEAYGSVQDIPIVQLKRDYKVVPRGDSVKLTCPIFGQPTPIITWSKGSETITDYAWTRFTLDKKSLKISQAEYDDTGIYICKGTNGYGSNEVRIDLFVIAAESYAKWNPKSGIPPVLTENTHHSEDTFYPPSGTDLSFSCSALGQPEPSIIWFKNMVRIETNPNLDGNNGDLNLRNLNQKDSGSYTCVAQNKHGHIAKNFSVHINEPIIVKNIESPTPDLIIPNDPENTTVEKDGKATLECKAKGKSTWLKKLQPGEVVDDPTKPIINLKPDAFLVIEESETRSLENLVDDSRDEFYISRLVLSKVTPADAGMYICVVNDHEEGKSTFKYAYLQVKEGEATSSNAISNETLYILVACLGAFVIFVFLVLIITFILRKNKKPTHRNADSPEARERMLEGASIPSNTQSPQQLVPNLTCPTNLQQEYFSAPAWATLPNNSKVGLPLPPIPMEKHDMSLSISNSSRNGQNHRQHHHQQHRFRR